jgi:predicted DNA-binding transcriptional regulator YafY
LFATPSLTRGSGDAEERSGDQARVCRRRIKSDVALARELRKATVPRTLTQIVRLWRICQFLQANGRATVPKLLSVVEDDCHERTLRRDLNLLSSAGFPIHDEREDGKTWWILDERYRSFPVPLTADELFALECGRELLRPLDSTLVGDSIKRLYGKIQSTLPAKQRELLNGLRRSLLIAPVDHRAVPDPTVADHLRHAIDRGRTIQMRYASTRPHRRRWRRADPYRLYYHDDYLYLIAYCRMNRQVRLFRVDRIQELRVTDQPFERFMYFRIEDFFRGAFGVYRGKPEPVVLVFESGAARWVRERRWHPSQKIDPLKDGKIRMYLDLAVTPDFAQWVRGFGPEVVVERPEYLARQVRDAAWRLLDRYEGVKKKTFKGSMVQGFKRR